MTDRKIIPIAEHPSNLDRTAVLSWENRRDMKHTYRVQGGYVACPSFGLAFADLFPTEDEAKAALYPPSV